MGCGLKKINLIFVIAPYTSSTRVKLYCDGKAMNALARAIFFGKHGEFREKKSQYQFQKANA